MKFVAVALAAVVGALPAGALAAAAAPPSVSSLDGTTFIQQPDAAATLAHATFVVRAGLDRQTLKQNGLAALTAETILRTPVGGVPLEDAVGARGGAIHVSVDPGDVRFEIESTPANASAVMDLVRQAFAAPAFDGKTVASARDALQQQIAMNQRIALRVGLDMLSPTMTASANSGMPSLGIPGSLAQLGPNDVRSFFTTFYRRGGSYVSAVGRLEALSPGALQALAATLPEGTTTALRVNLPPLKGTTHELVAHRDVPAPWLIAQYPAPAVTSKDYGPMLVLAAFMQRTLAQLAEVPGTVSTNPASRAVGAMYLFDRGNANLTLYVNGGIGNPNRAFATALSIASILAQTKLHGSIDTFKAMAAGDFVNGASSLESRAWLAVLFNENGNSPDYVGRTLAAIDGTTVADLQRVAKTYLGNPTIALVLPRQTGATQQ